MENIKYSLKAIVAMAKGNAIGRDGSLPWHLSEDLIHFKNTTMNHPIIMGRKTWESLPKRPLPGRPNIVITHNKNYEAEGAQTFCNIKDAIEALKDKPSPFLIGGAQIYNSFIPYCQEIIVTEIDTMVTDADAYFPELNVNEWEIEILSEWKISNNGLKYRFLKYSRK